MLTTDSGPRHFSAVTEMMFDNYRSGRQAAAASRKS